MGNSYSKLKERIIREAEEQAASIVAEATDRASDVRIEARQSAEREGSEQFESGKRSADSAGERLIAVGQLDIRNDRLRRRQELVDEVFSAAIDRIASMEADQYRGLVLRIISSVLEDGALGKEADSLHVHLAEADRDRLGEEMKEAILSMDQVTANVEVSVTYSDTIESGAILRMGSVEYNLTFEDLTDEVREGLEGELAVQLFGEAT